MNINIQLLLSIFIAFSMFAVAFGDEQNAVPPADEKMTPIDAKKAVRQMTPGINIGNTLEAIGTWETGWGNPLITKEYVETLARLGFKSVRLPVAWDTYSDKGNITKKQFDRVSEVVNWINDAGMYCVVNIHWDGGWIDSDVKEKFGLDYHTFSPEAEKKFRSYWQQISSFFKGKNEKLIFEAFNEESSFFKDGLPDYATLTRVNQIFVDTVRGTGGNNANRLLIIPGFTTDIDKTCQPEYQLPKDTVKGKLFISLHYYTPWTFVGLTQDASWGKMKPTWGDEQDIKQLNDLFDRLDDFCHKNDIPAYIGEFSMCSGKDPKSSNLWTSSVVNACLKRNMVPVRWDTGGAVSRKAPYTPSKELLEMPGLKEDSSKPHSFTAPPPLPLRMPREDLGVMQLDNEKLSWMLDDKIGLFIHWGLYAGPGRGEWMMHSEAVPFERYKKLATPEAGDEYFDASSFEPAKWAQLAKDAGMSWMCLTARHHDGFCLFDSPHPNAFTSVQTLHRDLIKEYTDACREAGLKVGLYYSPLSWRNPGYYDVYGTDCVKNAFGFKTDPSHVENARLMKEENYVNVKQLMTKYGKIDHIFWDGGWIAQRGTDADGAFFNEPGKYLDPQNRWQISKQYHDIDPDTGKPLGIMGMVRRYQPDAITNLRYGWMGDIIEEEGDYETTGPIRSDVIQNKNFSMQHGGWGYNAKCVSNGEIMTRDELVRMLANCLMRNMPMLVNVGPDRHGVIPELEQQRLREFGAWVRRMGESIYGTRGGPWQPVDHQYGFCFNGSVVYAHILKDQTGTNFQFPPLGSLKPVRVYDVWSGRDLPFEIDNTGNVRIHQLDRSTSNADTVVAVKYDRDITDVWKQ